ncbi:MAG: cysteine--tRNA ligase [Myxococcota bacterium]
MALRLHNTLTGEKEPLETRDPGHVRLYICGPTVYDYAHLGHARCYVVYDVLVRHLRASGWQVTYVRNFTDVDDKILNRAAEAGEDPAALAARFAQAYTEDMHRLGNLDPDEEPKVSDHMRSIIGLVERLLERGHAYRVNGDVYFHVPSFPGYGKLSHRKLEDLAAGASGRTSEEDAKKKKHPADFALWKSTRGGEPGFDSPWGRGRPGWHIECSAMSMQYLGETFDLHGGGLDLVFPHHENEIAQSEAATGAPFVRLWMHNGFVEVDKQKMSKSLGNFFTARSVFERVEPEAVRYVMLTMHYRAPLNLDWSLDDEGNVLGFPQFQEGERRLEYLYGTRRRLESMPDKRIVDRDAPVPPDIAELRGRLREALDDDLNMPVALARVNEFLRAVNELCDGATGKKGKAPRRAVEAARDGFAAVAEVLGIGQQEPHTILGRIRDRRARERGVEPEQVEARIRDRTEARQRKDFAAADGIRDELARLGVELHDGPEGTTWTVH